MTYYSGLAVSLKEVSQACFRGPENGLAFTAGNLSVAQSNQDS